MEESNVLKRYLDAGLALTQLTQSRAEALVRDLVKTGELQTEQAQTAVAELVERSRKNTERLFEQVRSEVREQVVNLGVATRADLKRVERDIAALKNKKKEPSAAPTRADIDRLERQIAALRAAPATAGRAGKAAPARKAAGKAAPARKAAGSAASRKASPAKKAPRRKAPAKKAGARKSAS